MFTSVPKVARVALVGFLLPTLWATGVGAGRDLRPDPPSYVAPSRSFDTIHTKLDLDLDLKNRTIAGSVAHTIRVLKPDTRSIRLNCVGLTVEAVTIDGRPAQFEYPVHGELATSWLETVAPKDASNLLVVHSDPPLSPDREIVLAVTYRGAPSEGLYFIRPEKGIPEKRYEVWAQGEGEDNRYWIPCHDYPNDKATFEGVFRVDKGMYAISNGVLVDRKDIGDKTEFHWKLDTPQVSYLITVAAGEYEVLEDKWKDVQLLYVVPPGTTKETVTRGYGLTPDMMEFFSNYIGIDYPFKKYGQIVVQDFIYGGMENTSATIMNSRTLYDDHLAVTQTQQGLVAHELAHQWWGDMVTCNEWSQIWLNEGFATYFQSLYREHHDGDDEFRYEIAGRHREIVTNDDKEALPIVVDFYNRKDSRNSANVYTKGASTLHMLRFLIGDAMFAASIRAYGEGHPYGLAATSDLARVVTTTTGDNLDWFFEQWVYLAGHPKLLVTKAWDDDTRSLRLTIRQTQKVEGLVPLFRLPMDVEITCAEKTETYRILVDAETQDFRFNLPSKPLMVIVDKGAWTLKTLDFDKPDDELLYQLQNGNTMARVEAARGLADSKGDDRVVSALGKVLASDGFWGLRREAALALGEIGGPRSQTLLVDALRASNARVRMAATEALGKLDTSEDLDKKLLDVLHSDYAYDVRATVVTSLVAMKSKQAKKACLEALGMESNREVIRIAGLNGLVELKATADIDKVKPLTTSGNRREYRHTAITTYAKLAKRLESENRREEASEFLCGMLDDWYLRTRTTVISALGELGDKSAVRPLRDVAHKDAIESIREQAAKVAQAIEDHREVVAEAETLKSEIEALSTKLDSLRRDLRSLQANVPVAPTSGGGATSGTDNSE